ncbi:MAG: tRNA-dihydrouridine synthase family protein [Clostridiales bacterium]|nr:tRNA-dihydrouridine synthase family protein [Clostridiales bacterium]
MTKNKLIDKLKLDGDLFLAPIAGYSDMGMRCLCYTYGATLCFTEMVSAKGLYYGNKNTAEILHLDDKEVGITGVQIFGHEPDIIGEVVGYKELENFPIIDINMGCPVPKIVKNNDGASLMKNPYLVKEMVSSAVKGAKGKLVSAKFRAGFGEVKNAPEIALACQEGGASFVTIHGRTREQYYAGDTDLDIIKKVKESVKIPVVGNGSVVDRDSYLKMKEYTGVDFVMVARGALGKPYVFSQIRGKDYDYNIKDLIEKHIAKLNFLPERVAVNNMKKHIAYYVKGRPNQKYIKEQIFKCTSIDELLRVDIGNFK